MLSWRARLGLLCISFGFAPASVSVGQCYFAEHWTQTSESAAFGRALALGPDMAAIGAPRLTSGGLERGGVYIYSGQPGLPWTWTITDVLIPDDVFGREEFGWSCALDEDLLVVGARRGDAENNQENFGTIHPFVRESDGHWLPLPRFRSLNPQQNEFLGETVAVSGSTIVAGSLNYDVQVPPREDTGRVVIFEPSPQDPDQWVEVQSLIPSTVTADASFGTAVAISGDTLVVGAPGSSEVGPDAGAAFVYERSADDADHWDLVARLEPTGLNPQGSDNFGCAVDTDGEYILVGARFQGGVAVKAGRVYVYRRDPNTGDWLDQSPVILTPPAGSTNHANFGSSVRLRDAVALVGAPATDNAIDPVGQAHIFHRISPTEWSPGPVLRSPDNQPESNFGNVVDLRDGLIVVSDFDWGPDDGAPVLGYGRTYWQRFVPGEGDCNNDGIADGCAVALGLAPDCDFDAVPDNCPGGQPIAVWLPEFKGVFSDPAAWCDVVPGPSHNAIFNSVAPDGLATEVIAIRAEQVRGLEVRAGHPRLMAAGLGSLLVRDSADAFDGVPVRVGTDAGVTALDLQGITLSVGDDVFPGSAVLAPWAGAIASMRLEDPDTLLDVSLDMVVGEQGTGSLVIASGAQLVCQELRIGSRTDAAGVGAVRLERSVGVAPNPSVTVHTQLSVDRGTLEVERQCVLSYSQMSIERHGVVRSDAILRGSVLNLGTVEILNSPRDLVVQGDYRQVQVDGSSTRIGRLRLDLGSGAPGDHDRLEVNQTAQFSGGLLISADPSFDPEAGTEYEIIHANVNKGGGSLLGRFSVATFPGLSGLKFVRLSYDETDRAVKLVIDSLESDSESDFGGSQNYPVSADVRDGALGLVTPDPNPGFVDLVLVVGGENPEDPGAVIIFTNDGTPDGDGNQFIAQTTVALATDPIAVDVGEIDNDPNGLDDIVVANADGSVTVLRNLGTVSPSFAVINFPGVIDQPSDIRLADLDRDLGGRLDFAVVGRDTAGNGVVVTRLNLGDIGPDWDGFALQRFVDTGSGTLTIADVGDLDNDKDFDLIGLRDHGASFAMCVNQGGGEGVFWNGLAYSQDHDFEFEAVSVDIGDLDNDKDFDVIASGRSDDDGAFGVFLNDPKAGGLGAAIVFPLEGVVGPIVLANLDADDDLDAAVAIQDPKLGPIVRTLRNDLTFEDGMPRLAFSIADVFSTNAPAELLLAGTVDAQVGDDLVIIEDHLGGLLGSRGAGGLIASVQVRPVVPAEEPECRVDLNDDGVVDFFDMLEFLEAFSQGNPIADWNGDTLFDFFDLLGFLGAYEEGCP